MTMVATGCSFLRPNLNASQPPPEITYNSVQGSCSTPDEVHRVPPSPINPAPYLVLYFESCLSRDNIVVVAWPGENSDINTQFAHLLGLHFEDALSFRKHVGHTYTRVGPLSDTDGTAWMLVYHLTPVSE